MIIRAAHPDEAERLSALALRSKAYWGYDDAFMAACVEELTLDPAELAAHRTVVAERDGRALGFATLEGDAPSAVLGMLFVEPDAIGQGVGRRLFDHVSAVAGGLGCTGFRIDADPHAEPFYLAMGATRIGTTPSASVPGRLLPLLEVALTR